MKRRREILRKAAEIFERDGYGAASIESIADAVGVKREAIYYYFRNKAQILNAVIRPASVAMLDGIDVILGMDISSREKLLLALQNHIDRFNPNFLEMSVIARDQQLLEKLPACRELAKIWRRYTIRWITLVTEGQENGQFVNTLNAKVVAYTILGMCNWLSRWYDPAKSISATEIVHIYFHLIGGGLIVNFAKDRQFELSSKTMTVSPTLKKVKGSHGIVAKANTRSTNNRGRANRDAAPQSRGSAPTRAATKSAPRRNGPRSRSSAL
jgi:TetR/AcrR family transcriptional regulator, cholesterol catabolism regulator